jgi:ribonuclease HI
MSIVYCDASFDNKTCATGIGLLCYGCSDKELIFICDGISDSNIAELLAACQGLMLLIKSNALKTSTLVTDSDYVLRLFNDNTPHPVMDEFKTLANLLPSFKIKCVAGHRGSSAPENTHVDNLAKRAMRAMRDSDNSFLKSASHLRITDVAHSFFMRGDI